MRLKSVFSVIGGITLAANAGTPVPPFKTYSLRGLQCEMIEFAELNTYSSDELEQNICSIRKGFDLANDRSKAAAKDQNINKTIVTLEYSIAQMEKCSRALSISTDTYQRKFSKKEPVCTAYGKPKPAETEK